MAKKTTVPEKPIETPNTPWNNPQGVADTLNSVKYAKDKNGNFIMPQEYRNSVPDAIISNRNGRAVDNLIDVGNPIISYTPNMNLFINTLVNRIGFTWVHAKTFYNKLFPLKKGGIPLGDTVQEIGVNPAEANMYTLCDDNSANEFFRCCNPDVKAAYHTLNRRGKYCVSISQDVLQEAFANWEAFGQFMDSLVLTLYNGDEIDEFNLAKNLFWTAYSEGHIKQVEVDPVIDEITAKNLVRQLRYYVEVLQEPSTEYNAWGLLNPGQSFTTWTSDPRNLILIIRADVASYIDVDVLAAAFNLDKAEYLANRIVIANFGPNDNGNLLAVLCDITWPQIWDTNKKVTDFYNPSELIWKFWLHHWQIYSFSPLSNAVAFTTETVDPQPPTTPDLISNINFTGITLTPTFDPTVTSYTGSTTSNTTTITVSSNYAPIITHNNATISNGSVVTLTEGANAFNIFVSDGTSSKQYLVNVTYTPPAE